MNVFEAALTQFFGTTFVVGICLGLTLCLYRKFRGNEHSV